MKIAGKKKHSEIIAFWDISAIVPLCCLQRTSIQARQLARTYGQQIVWWATSVEAISALQRLTREENISLKDGAQFYLRLEHLRNHWHEIQPNTVLKEQAERLLRMHKLRAADALQLAAALFWCNNGPRGRVFIASDGALLSAAQIEGFSVLSL